MEIRPSARGFSAYMNDQQVAFSHDRGLLEEYLADLDNPEITVTVVQEPVTVDLVDVTYTTRARSTGATCSAGRTVDGWGARCVAHGAGRVCKSRTEAETVVSRPQEWCTQCGDIVAGRAPKIPKAVMADLEDLL